MCAYVSASAYVSVCAYVFASVGELTKRTCGFGRRNGEESVAFEDSKNRVWKKKLFLFFLARPQGEKSAQPPSAGGPIAISSKEGAPHCREVSGHILPNLLPHAGPLRCRLAGLMSLSVL